MAMANPAASMTVAMVLILFMGFLLACVLEVVHITVGCSRTRDKRAWNIHGRRR